MNKIIFSFFLIFILVGCDSKEAEARLQKEIISKTFTTTSYNYTKYDLYSIAFKDIVLPFNIDNAPSGGSVFFRDASQVNLDNGEKVSFSSGNCCFIWDRPIDKPIRVRVVWSVVYDTSFHDGKSSESYDQRTSKQGAPGSRWCQAIVDIRPSEASERPNMVFFHFLGDGSVQARLGTLETGGVLPSSEVKLHSSGLPPGTYCKQEIINPFYGIPRTPHRE